MALGTKDLPEPNPPSGSIKLFKPVGDGSAELAGLVKAGIKFGEAMKERKDEKVLDEFDASVASVFQDPNQEGGEADVRAANAEDLEKQLKDDPDGRRFVRDMDRLEARRVQGRNPRGDLDRVHAIVREMSNKHPARAELIEAYARKKYGLEVGVEAQVKKAQDAAAFQDDIAKSIIRSNVATAQEQGLFFATPDGSPDVKKMNAAGAQYKEWKRQNEEGSSSGSAGLSQAERLDLETREATGRAMTYFNMNAESLVSGLNTLVPKAGDTRTPDQLQEESALMRSNVQQARNKVIPQLRSELTMARTAPDKDGNTQFQFSQTAVDAAVAAVEKQFDYLEENTKFTSEEIKFQYDFAKNYRSLQTERQYGDLLQWKETGMLDLVLAQDPVAVTQILNKSGVTDSIVNTLSNLGAGAREVTVSQILYNVNKVSTGETEIPTLPPEERPATEALNVKGLLNGAKMTMDDMKPEVQSAWLNNYQANNVNIASKDNLSDVRNGMFLYNAPGVQDKLVQFAQQSQDPQQQEFAKQKAQESVAVISSALPKIAGKMLLDIDPKVARYVYNPDTGRVEIEAVAPWTMRRVRQSRAKGDVREKTQEIQFQRINPEIPTVIRETTSVRTQELANMDALNAGMSAMLKVKPLTTQAGVPDRAISEYFFVNMIGLPIMGGPRDGFAADSNASEQAAEFFGPMQEEQAPAPVPAIRLVRDPDTGLLVEAEE